MRAREEKQQTRDTVINALLLGYLVNIRADYSDYRIMLRAALISRPEGHTGAGRAAALRVFSTKDSGRWTYFILGEMTRQIKPDSNGVIIDQRANFLRPVARFAGKIPGLAFGFTSDQFNSSPDETKILEWTQYRVS